MGAMDKKRQIERRREAFIRFMQRRGLTVADLARRTRVAATTLYSYTSGKSDSLKGTTEQAIADGLGVKTSDLYAEEGASESPGAFDNIEGDPFKAAYLLAEEISKARPKPLTAAQKAELARKFYEALTSLDSID